MGWESSCSCPYMPWHIRTTTQLRYTPSVTSSRLGNVLVAYFSFFVCLAEALRDMVTAIVVKFSEYVDGQNLDHYRGEPRRTADAIYSECGKSTLGDVLRTSAASDVICLVIWYLTIVPVVQNADNTKQLVLFVHLYLLRIVLQYRFLCKFVIATCMWLITYNSVYRTECDVTLIRLWQPKAGLIVNKSYKI